MMDMVHRNRPEGTTLFARVIHLMLMWQPSLQSVRDRIFHLKQNLVAETMAGQRRGQRTRFLDVGCGPAREVQYFLRDHPLADHADFTLLDFNEETLAYTGGVLRSLRSTHGRRGEITLLKMPVQQLLKRSVKEAGVLAEQPFDVIYCAGLFDYLSDATVRALVRLFYQNVRPGGLVLVSNFDDCKPFRNFIELVLDWYLIYRTGPAMAAFTPDEAAEHSRVVAEPTGCNVFLHLRKPE
jgi:extracellular factor (EF) 3-hydroxypalmitic acid methyl ester biosynthesis protein